MNCPICKESKLLKTLFNNVEVDRCSKCSGLWFEQEELAQAKNNKDKNLSWVDVDLWKESTKFKISSGIRVCPSCRVPLYEIRYGDSGVIVDVCNICHGVWLDKAEFKKIIEWLKETSDYEIMHNYAKNAFKEFTDIFTGPESLRDEILDFIIILNLFGYKFAGEHSILSSALLYLPR